MAELIQRPRFFEGQVLGSTDLTAGLEYTRSQEARHDRLVHSWGIADGLALVKIEQPDGTSIVRLRAGMAIDGTGREIVVPQDVTLDEKLFVRTNVAVGDVEALYPVMLAGADSFALPIAVGRSCTAAQASRTVESYKLAFGAPGDERTIDVQKPPPVDQGAGGAPNQPRWWIVLGFVRWDASTRRFTGIAERANTVGRRYVGIRADEVTAQGGSLVLRSRHPGHLRKPTLTLHETVVGGTLSLGVDDGHGTSLPKLTIDSEGMIEGNAGQLTLRSGAARVVGKPMLALAETAGGGTLTFGLQDTSGKPSPLMSVDELGNLSIAGMFNGLVAGGVKVASGIASDGLVLPLPDGVTEAHVAAGTVALHILVVPHAPGAAPYDANLTAYPHWIGRPLTVSVDANRRLTCRIHWLGFHGSGGAPLAENLGGACDYLVLAVGQATP